MADLLLADSGDLDLSTNDLQLVEGLAAVRQGLQIRYRFFIGEWFLNREEGTPYHPHILKKNSNETKVRAILAEVARTTPGVVEIRNLTASYNNPNRQLTVALEVGAEVNGVLVYEPFIIEVEI